MTWRLSPVGLFVAACAVCLVPVAALAQPGPPGPPAVGVVKAERQAITETSEFVGRVQAVDRVDLSARVTAFIQERLFTEGSEVNAGDLLLRLERAPFEADLQQKAATVAQDAALLDNANNTLNRARSLLNTPAGQRSVFDDAQAQSLSLAAQMMSARAQLRASQINLDYTEIHAPIAGRIGTSAFSVGNVVGPTSGPLATIVSQDPMYVTFNVSVRAELDLRNRFADRGGMAAVVVKLRLPDQRMYGQEGKIDFIAPTVTANTDTVLLRARLPNPPRGPVKPGDTPDRELTDGEFVTVVMEGVAPIEALGIPRSAILSDQAGNYVYVVDSQNRAQQRRVQLGQSTAATAVVLAGLEAGETVVAEGLQRVRPGAPVNPGPVAAAPAPK